MVSKKPAREGLHDVSSHLCWYQQHQHPELAEKGRILRADLGFMFKDWDIVHDYGTAENAIRIYGFIFGPKAIAYFEQTGQTKIRFRM
jgi:hypothetical protein